LSDGDLVHVRFKHVDLQVNFRKVDDFKQMLGWTDHLSDD
jgi:hypothetical protein